MAKGARRSRRFQHLIARFFDLTMKSGCYIIATYLGKGRTERDDTMGFAKLMTAILVGLWLNLRGASGGVLFTNLYSFTGNSDGGFPWGALVQGSDGNLYGTANYGGTRSSILGYGTVYRLTLDGEFQQLYAFENNGDGNHPFFSGLVEDVDGLFYGTTVGGGYNQNGAVFVIFPDGLLFPIYSFSPYNYDGAGPRSGLVLGTDGSLYGTTAAGGQNLYGTVFRITSDWDYTRLFSFNGTNGASPYCALIQARDGNLYGTTLNGGADFHGRDTSGNPTGFGTVFKISTNGIVSALFSFNGTNGQTPVAGLVEGRDGSLYGTTELGGANTNGTVFKIATNGTFTLLHSFAGGGNGAYPTAPLVQASDGNFYGTTADIPFIGGGPSVGSGTVFRITPNGVFTKLYSFPGRPGGVEPVTGLLQASDGNLYGATSGGGAYNFGMIFRLGVPISPVFQTVTKTGSQVTLTWTVVAGFTYQLQYSSNPGISNWSNLGNAVIATNGTMSASDSVAAESHRQYRVVLLQ